MDRNEFLEPLPLTRIVLKLTSASLTLRTDDIDDIHVMVSGADADVNTLRIAVSGNQLLVEQPALSLQKNPIGASWLQVTIRLPLDWKGRIDGRTVSGWINAHSLNGSDLTLDSVSGLISADALTFTDITLRTVVGDIRAADVTCVHATLATTSGAIGVRGASIGQCALTSITGAMTLAFRTPFDSLTATSVTGDLAIDAPITRCGVTHRSVTGRVTAGSIAIEDGATPTVHFNTVAGNLDISQPEPAQ